MKAIQVARYGQAEALQLQEVPDLEPNDDQVLINVAGSGINPIDWKILSGAMQQYIPLPLPYTPGVEVSGTVAAVGKNVSDFVVGDQVFGFIGIVGGYATQAVSTADRLAHIPATLPLQQAGGVPAAALTAWQALHEHAAIQAGQKVLIHGGAGGVGSFAIQLAHLAGAYVIATSSAKNHEYLRSLGADEVIDYSATPFEEVVHDVDFVLDTMGGDTQDRSWGVLKPGGQLVTLVYLPPGAEETAAARGVRATLIGTRPDPAQLRELAALIDAGQIRPMVNVVRPLSETRQVQDLSQTGHARGQLVLRVGDD